MQSCHTAANRTPRNESDLVEATAAATALALIGANIIVFLLGLSASSDRVIDLLALWPLQSHVSGGPHFHLWQILSYSLLHANVEHLALNMFGLYMFGRDVERGLGGKRFFAFYLASVASGATVQLVVSRAQAGDVYPTIGASAGVFGVLIAYALFFPQRRVILLFPACADARMDVRDLLCVSRTNAGSQWQ